MVYSLMMIVIQKRPGRIQPIPYGCHQFPLITIRLIILRVLS
jgi:hypothetical protein